MTRTTRALPATLTVRPLVVPTDTPHADLGDIRELVRLGNVVNRQDAGHPFFDELPEEVVPVWRDQRDTTRVGFFAQDDGTTVGALTIEMPNEPGAATAEFEIMIEPSRRGEGIEEGLLDVLEQTARDRGRSILQTWTLHPRDTTGVVLRSPTGFGAIPADDPQARFLQRHGFTFEQVERNSTLDLRADPAPIARTLEDAKAFAGPDYEVIAWSTPTPREYADGFAYALSRMATDVPSAGMVWEEETWDAARIARRDARLQAAGNTVSVAGVRHLPSGRIVAFNELMIGRDHAGTTHQWGTLVLKEHRGHRLGTVVKCANLLRWREQVPESPRVSTFNAEENRPMLDINEAIGFVPASYAGAWKKVLS